MKSEIYGIGNFHIETQKKAKQTKPQRLKRFIIFFICEIDKKTDF